MLSISQTFPKVLNLFSIIIVYHCFVCHCYAFTDDDLDNRWNWQTSQLLETTEDSSEVMSVFMSSLVAISPMADLIAFAKTRYLALYRVRTSLDATVVADGPDRPDGPITSKEPQLCLENQVSIGYSPQEVITSVLLLPIVGQQKSSFAFHDWTAVIVGFSSGFLKIYTEKGCLVLSRLLHTEPIVDIKCQTFRSNSDSSDCDRILVLYQTIVVLIEGLSLYQTLRFCRSQLAKTQSSSTMLSSSSLDESVNLTYRKWKLLESEVIRDCDYIGFNTRTIFDNLFAQSLHNGPYGPLRMTSPPAHLLITCGEGPYVGFYRALEESTPILNELTQAMVNKVKNMIPFGGMFSGKHYESQSQSQKIEPSTNIPLSLGLYDLRLGLKVSLSPNKSVAAVIDDFGRVTLIDVEQHIAIRMFKGYRDAQVGWVEVSEDKTQDSKRVTFLVIYAPKRGILEIWVSQLGPRVGAFNVGRNCRLIQSQHSMMGLNDLLIRQFKDSTDIERSRCFIFDYNSGEFFEIQIPYLCALTDTDSKESRDLLLLKELQQIIQNVKSIDSRKAVQLILLLRTADIRRDAIKEICLTSDIDLIIDANEQLRQQLMSLLEENQLDFDNKLVLQMCSRILQLCRFYKLINSIKSDNNYVEESSNPPDIQCLIEELNWTGSDIARTLSLNAFNDAINKTDFNSYPSNRNTLSIGDLLSKFSLYSNHLHKVDDKEVYTDLPIELTFDSVNKSQTDRYIDLSNFIFGPILQTTNGLDLETIFKTSSILSSNLLILIFKSWLSSMFCKYWKCWQYFSQTLNVLMKMLKEERSSKNNDITDIAAEEEDLLSDDWNEILDLVYDSDNIMAALISVHMIKAINTEEKNRDKMREEEKKFISCPDTEWETLHIDNESLNLVAKQLEDVFLLDMLLHSSLSDNHQVRCEAQPIRISLSYLLRSGPGIVSELVAKWVINSNIKPDMLSTIIVEASDSFNHETSEVDHISIGVEAIEYKMIDLKTTSELLDHVRRCFPHCLEADVLLVNCCWEMMVRWNKEPAVVDNSLQDSLDFLNLVSSAVLRHNVGCLLWKTFVMKRFESMSNLIEKMGRTPKDRICLKEFGIHENRVEAFVEFGQQLLDLILSSSMSAEMEPLPLFQVDDWWKWSQSLVRPIGDHPSQHSTPLVIMAIHQKTANGALVLEHSRLATVIQFIVTFQMRSSRPLSLFSDAIKQYFFKELHTFPVCSTNSDKCLTEKRTKFLFNVISGIVQTLPVHNMSGNTCQLLIYLPIVSSNALLF